MKNLVIECKCGASYYATEDKLLKTLDCIFKCRGNITLDGKRIECKEEYSHRLLLRIMRITRFWNANDHITREKAEYIKIEP